MPQLPQLRTSELRFYSYGYAAANKDLNNIWSDVAEIVPTEAFPFLDGEISDNQDKTVVKGTSINGQAYSDTLVTSASIQAKWLRLGTGNRVTAPNLRRGEPVILYQFGDLPEYWWMTIKEDMKFRRLETIVYAISGSPKENEPLTPQNSYYFEWSTHRKHITLHTSQANGEPYAFDIQLNTAEGKFTITDNAGQYLHWDSPAKFIELMNADLTHVVLNQKNALIQAPETVQITCKDLKISASNSVSVSTNHYSCNAGSDLSLSTNAYSCNASSGSYSISSGYQVNAMTVDIQGSGSLQAKGPGGGIVNAGGATSIS